MDESEKETRTGCPRKESLVAKKQQYDPQGWNYSINISELSVPRRTERESIAPTSKMISISRKSETLSERDLHA